MYRSRRPIFWVTGNKRLPKAAVAIVILLFLFICGFVVLERNLKPTIQAYSETKAKQIAVDSINDVINEKIVPSVHYEDLVKIHKDGDSKVTMVQPNIVKINQIEAEASTEVNKTLKNLSKGEFKIPLGQALGSQLLASLGPKIKVSFVPIGTVKIDTIDTVEDTGINQTRHKIFFRITSQVQVVIPMVTSNVNFSSDIMIADNLILGDVPQTYVNFNMDGNNNLGLSKDILKGGK